MAVLNAGNSGGRLLSDGMGRAALTRMPRDVLGHAGVRLDVDALLRDPMHPSRLAPAVDSGDHLHPGDAGYALLAEAVDVKALLGE